MLGRFAGGVERSVEVDRHNTTPVLAGHLEEARRRTTHTGINEHRVNPTERIGSLLHRLDHGGLVADITDDRQQLDVIFTQNVESSFVLLGVGPPDRHVCSVRCQPLGHAEANAAVPSGNQSNAAGEIEW